ncbi:ligand-dependent nuclear receptor-interacting factor 1 isoform X2 [Scyliorhinus canicula]|uniref:ligand-dependent nuclear receptor-interacting factor 1 isoform X2 n=1 Tax=Scyliorhinus canicula TaxID=7830 RepID=UPI0018F369EF|nr:ligand-dependent nuclear receptor-interacting factor 1 isoform X2 [Scyliorhinus canicula]XP_038675450.1 ligand-dependent nuclear receptor-interacting factor 1 isoform X2 [Scyliorhinus canicula]
MNDRPPLVLHDADSSGTIQCNSGCMYRIVQTTSLDGKNLLKLIPLSSIPGQYIPVSVPLSTGSTSSKVNVSTVFQVATPSKTTACSAPTACFPVLQHSNTARFLITSFEGSTSQSVTSPVNPSQDNIFTAPAVASLQCPSLTTVTLPGLPVQRSQTTPSLNTEQKSYNLGTVALHDPTVQKTQPSTLPADQNSYNLRTVTLPGAPVQRAQASPTLAPDQMAYNLTAVTLAGPAGQNAQASCISATDQNTCMLLKSPVLPAGHHLQIPANAEVKSVPASSLPLAIQQKILSTAASSLTNTTEFTKSSPTVIYVCPVNTVKTVQKRLPNIRPKSILNLSTTLITGDASFPNPTAPATFAYGGVVSNEQILSTDSPMKWVVQKNPQTLAHCLIPVKSSNNLASKILKSLADQQHTESSNTNPAPSPLTTPAQTAADLFSPFKENALVMYNGKVYLVVQKNGGLPSPCPKSVPASMNHAEKENAGIAILRQTDLLTNIKEEPEDPQPVEQKKQFLSQPTDYCRTAVSVQSIHDQHRAQDIPGTLHEHSKWICGTARDETDEQLLKKAGIHANLRICLTRISQKQLEQWEKSNSPTTSDPLELPSCLSRKMDNAKTEAVSKEMQMNLVLPAIKREEPTETEYFAYHSKNIEIKLEPKSPVKRKAERIHCPVSEKKQCLKRLIPNWESEHAYSCLPVYNAEAPSHNTEATSCLDSHCGQEVFTSSAQAISVLEDNMIMESFPMTTFSTGTDSVPNPSTDSTNPVSEPSTSTPSMECSPTTEISAACSYSSLPSSSIDETTRDEKIKRLKAILKEKEVALEAIRKKMIKTKAAEKSKARKSKCPSTSKKQRCKKWVLNRESEHAYSCLPGQETGGEAHMATRSGHDRLSGSKPVHTRQTEPCTRENFPLVQTLPPGDKTPRDEKIKLLKEILKEKEAALESIRRKKISALS